MAHGNETFDRIMAHIRSGLTGQWDLDRAYLQAQMEAYKDHELSKEIIRSCGRLMYELTPKDLRAELDQVIRGRSDEVTETLNEVTRNMQTGNWAAASAIIEPLAATCDDLIESGWCADDAKSRYFDFRSATDEIVWRARNDDPRTVRRATDPFARIYATLGSCLVEARRYDEAIVACEKAIRWNPANVDARFELGECYKVLRDVTAYGQVLDELYPYVASAFDLAHYHRAMGYLRIEQGSLQVAAAHLIVSLLFDTSSYAISELAYIKREFGHDYTNMEPDEAIAILVESGERVLIDERTFQALVQTLGVSMQYQDYETALSVARELYNFTRDDTYKDIARQLAGTLGLD